MHRGQFAGIRALYEPGGIWPNGTLGTWAECRITMPAWLNAQGRQGGF